MRTALIFSVMTLMLLGAASFADAQALSNPRGGIPTQIVPDCEGDKCTFDHLIQLAQNLLNFMIFIGVTISALMFAYAGYLMTIHATEHGKVEQAKKIVGYVVGGLIIMLVAWLGVDTFLRVLTGKGFNERQSMRVPTELLTIEPSFDTVRVS